jgi:hypothetical protein
MPSYPYIYTHLSKRWFPPEVGPQKEEVLAHRGMKLLVVPHVNEKRQPYVMVPGYLNPKRREVEGDKGTVFSEVRPVDKRYQESVRRLLERNGFLGRVTF